jgi:ferredoxin
MTILQVSIDRSACTGHGRCYSLAPSLFEPDDDGYGQQIVDIVPDGAAEAASLATRSCPERAIHLQEVQSCPS